MVHGTHCESQQIQQNFWDNRVRSGLVTVSFDTSKCIRLDDLMKPLSASCGIACCAHFAECAIGCMVRTLLRVPVPFAEYASTLVPFAEGHSAVVLYAISSTSCSLEQGVFRDPGLRSRWLIRVQLVEIS
eukprot:jgi/Botrbrau1/17179/Bobra.0157s0070.1